MGKIYTADIKDAEYIGVAQQSYENQSHQVTANVEMREIFGSQNTPELFEVLYPPNADVDPHAHYEDEVMYIVDGSVLLGKNVLAAGSALRIDKLTLYGFKVGPDGARVINFRPRKAEKRIISKAEFLEARTAGTQDGSD